MKEEVHRLRFERQRLVELGNSLRAKLRVVDTPQDWHSHSKDMWSRERGCIENRKLQQELEASVQSRSSGEKAAGSGEPSKARLASRGLNLTSISSAFNPAGFAQLIAAERGCRWSTDLDEALLPGPDAVDAVIVASATDTHFPYIMKALRADKAVLAEKPISHELHEVMEAVQLAKSRNLAFVCGYQRRADRHFRELKRHLDAGAIGNLKVLKTCSRDNPIPPMEYLRTSGGIFHDMLIHDFDMLDFLSGGQVPESVTAIGHSYNPEIKAMGDVDTCAVMFKYPSGLIAMVDTSRDASYGYDQRIEAFGEHGMLSAKNELTSTVELATAEGHLMPPAMYSFPQRYLQAYRSELTEFIELVQAGCDSQLHHLEQEAMLRHPNIVRTTLAAELSWKLGKTVAVAEVGQLKAEDVQMSDAVSTSSGSGELKEFWRTDSAVSGA
eukprot:g28058.t1